MDGRKCGINHAGLAGSRYRWGKLMRGAAWAADRHCWRDSGRRRRLSWRASNFIEWLSSLGFAVTLLNIFNGITEKYQTIPQKNSVGRYAIRKTFKRTSWPIQKLSIDWLRKIRWSLGNTRSREDRYIGRHIRSNVICLQLYTKWRGQLYSKHTIVTIVYKVYNKGASHTYPE